MWNKVYIVGDSVEEARAMQAGAKCDAVIERCETGLGIRLG